MNTPFGPAELLKYMGMGDERSMARGREQFKKDVQAMPGYPKAPMPEGGAPAGAIPMGAMLGGAMPAGMPMPGQPPMPTPGAQSPLAQALAQRQLGGPQGVMGQGGVMGVQPLRRG